MAGNSTTGLYGAGDQASQALALEEDMVPAELRQQVLDDVLHDWVQRRDGTSYGSFLQRGATSLPESWNSANASQNHYMLGAIDSWFTARVAGISQAPGSVAWEQVVIEPALVGDVASASAEYDSVRGTIRSAWKRAGGAVTLDVAVPGNTQAVVRVPVADGGEVQAPRGAQARPSRVEGYAEFLVGPGSHRFAAPLA